MGENHRFISRKEAAERLHVVPQTISNWIDKGILKAIRNGNKQLVDSYLIDKLLEDDISTNEALYELRKMKRERRALITELEGEISLWKSANNLIPKTSASNILCKSISSLCKVAFSHSLLEKKRALYIETLRQIAEGESVESVANNLNVSAPTIKAYAAKGIKAISKLENYEDLITVRNNLQDRLDDLEHLYEKVCRERDEYKWKYDSLAGVFKGSNRNQVPTEEELCIYDILSKPVSFLNLTVRCNNCFNSKDIRTVWDLVLETKESLLRIRCMGKKSLYNIVDALQEYNLSLGMDKEFLEDLDRRVRLYRLDKLKNVK